MALSGVPRGKNIFLNHLISILTSYFYRAINPFSVHQLHYSNKARSSKETNMSEFKTYSLPREKALNQRKWYIIDASGQILGRLASKIADTLRGKHKVEYTPHVDNGDFVVVINAEKIRVTGRKLKQKKYYHHSGYPGGIKEITLEKLLQKKPERVIYNAVKGMLPKNRLSRAQLKKLKIYAGEEHPHSAQKPIPLELKKL